MIKNRNKDRVIRVCDKCGDEKEVNYWTVYRKKEHLCKSCSFKGINKGKIPYNKGKKQEPKHIGNIYTHSDGYPMVWVGKTNVLTGYMPVHRLLVSDMIGRLLTVEEKVHHINGIKDDYREENLYLCENMSHHRKIHAQLEALSLYLVQLGLIEFGFKRGEYKYSRPIKQLIEEKLGELLESPDKDNQQLSSEELAEKVQRLFRKEVDSRESKRPAPEMDDDIVCS